MLFVQNEASLVNCWWKRAQFFRTARLTNNSAAPLWKILVVLWVPTNIVLHFRFLVVILDKEKSEEGIDQDVRGCCVDSRSSADTG